MVTVAQQVGVDRSPLVVMTPAYQRRVDLKKPRLRSGFKMRYATKCY